MRFRDVGWLVGVVLTSCARVPEAKTETAQLERIDDLPALVSAVTPGDRPLVIHLWAQWCRACMDDLGASAELARKLRDQNAEVLFINLDRLGGFEDEGSLAAVFVRHPALLRARQTILSSELDPAALNGLFDERWRGEIPATFVKRPDGKGSLTFTGALSKPQQARILAAVAGR